MRNPVGGNLLRMDAAFTKSPSYDEMRAALRFVGCETYAQMLALPPLDQIRFQREWTRLMQVRCRIDPNARPAETIPAVPMTRAERLTARKEQAALRAEREAIVRRLYAEGAGDSAIGEALGVSRARATQIRSRLGLIAHLDRSRLEMETFVRTGHADGQTDFAMAATLGVQPRVVGEVRRRLGLRRHGWGGRIPVTAEQRRAA